MGYIVSFIIIGIIIWAFVSKIKDKMDSGYSFGEAVEDIAMDLENDALKKANDAYKNKNKDK